MGLSDGIPCRGDGGREVALLTHDATQTGQVRPYRSIALDEVVSTNDEAMARLRDGDPGGLLVTAFRQTGGRGRQGRAWTSPPGNLYASLALRLQIAPVVAPQLGFVTGVALAKVLRARLGGDLSLRIKWPNDITHAGAKLAGILLESTLLRDGHVGCVIGVGVNCRSHPEDLPYATTDLATCGDMVPEPATILAAFAEAMAQELAIWDAGAHFAITRSSWLALAVPPGTVLKVALSDRQLLGTFEGLDQTGRLMLDTSNGVVAIEAGDVFLPEMSKIS